MSNRRTIGRRTVNVVARVPSRPAAEQSLTALGGLAGTLVGAPAMGYGIDTWGFSAAWLILGAMSAFALVGTFLMRGEEELALE